MKELFVYIRRLVPVLAGLALAGCESVTPEVIYPPCSTCIDQQAAAAVKYYEVHNRLPQSLAPRVVDGGANVQYQNLTTTSSVLWCETSSTQLSAHQKVSARNGDYTFINTRQGRNFDIMMLWIYNNGVQELAGSYSIPPPRGEE